MVCGQLEVILIGANSLENNDFLGAGSNPYWNESFVYSVNSDDVCELELKLMDADSLTQNDFLGGAKIPFHSVFEGRGMIIAADYQLINNNQEHCGEIQVAFLFDREVRGRAGA
ncbi:hypothetical protein P8452_74341 [Trifolium repens]|nr:hypothetical protein P8452_74341 [Trifolium repens]